MSIEEITQQITEHFDRQVRDLSQEDYRDVLEEVIADLEGKLDAVKSELEDDTDE